MCLYLTAGVSGNGFLDPGNGNGNDSAYSRTGNRIQIVFLFWERDQKLNSQFLGKGIQEFPKTNQLTSKYTFNVSYFFTEQTSSSLFSSPPLQGWGFCSSLEIHDLGNRKPVFLGMYGNENYRSPLVFELHFIIFLSTRFCLQFPPGCHPTWPTIMICLEWWLNLDIRLFLFCLIFS